MLLLLWCLSSMISIFHSSGFKPPSLDGIAFRRYVLYPSLRAFQKQEPPPRGLTRLLFLKGSQGWTIITEHRTQFLKISFMLCGLQNTANLFWRVNLVFFFEIRSVGLALRWKFKSLKAFCPRIMCICSWVFHHICRLAMWCKRWKVARRTKRCSDFPTWREFTGAAIFGPGAIFVRRVAGLQRKPYFSILNSTQINLPAQAGSCLVLAIPDFVQFLI